MTYWMNSGILSCDGLPEFIQYVMKFAPTTYFVEFSDAILFRGAGLQLIWKTFLGIFLLGAGYFFVALSRFRKTVAS